MNQVPLESREDLLWLREVHRVETLGVAIAILYGKEDWPDHVKTYARNHYKCRPVTWVADEDGYLQCTSERFALFKSYDDEGTYFLTECGLFVKTNDTLASIGDKQRKGLAPKIYSRRSDADKACKRRAGSRVVMFNALLFKGDLECA